MKNYIKYASFALLSAILLAFSGYIANAQQATQTAIIAPINAQCYQFTTNLKFGDRGVAVGRLHQILQREGFSISDSEMPQRDGQTIADSYFGESTASAVVGYQQKYASEILVPNGLKFGTGYVGPSTRARLNKCSGGTNDLNIIINPVGYEGSYSAFTLSASIGNSSVTNWAMYISCPPGVTDMMKGGACNANSNYSGNSLNQVSLLFSNINSNYSDLPVILSAYDSTGQLVTQGKSSIRVPINAGQNTSSISIINPTAGEIVRSGQKYLINWGGNWSGNDVFDITEFNSGGKGLIASNITQAQAGCAGYGKSVCSYSWTPQSSEQTQSYQIAVTDQRGTGNIAYSGWFTLSSGNIPGSQSVNLTSIPNNTNPPNSYDYQITSGKSFDKVVLRADCSNDEVIIGAKGGLYCGESITIPLSSRSKYSYPIDWTSKDSADHTAGITATVYSNGVFVGTDRDAVTVYGKSNRWNKDTVSATLIDASSDKIGSGFGQSVGIGNNNPADWHFRATINTTTAKKIKSINITHGFGEAWSTNDSRYYPIAIYYKDASLNSYYGQPIDQGVNGTLNLDLYVQPESTPFRGGNIVVAFTDGTTAQGTIPASYIPQSRNVSCATNDNRCSTYTGTNKPPVIKGGVFPSTLKINEVGTWTLNAYDPEGGALSYSVSWGDSGCPAGFVCTASPSIGQSYTQSSTFTHSYSGPGTYKVVFTVTDNGGLSNTTSATVKVLDNPIVPIPLPQPTITVLSPNGGEYIDNTSSILSHSLTTISWASRNVSSSGVVDINLVSISNPGKVFMTIAQNVSSSGSYNWFRDSALPSGSYKINIQYHDKDGKTAEDSSDGYFKIVSNDGPVPYLPPATTY